MGAIFSLIAWTVGGFIIFGICAFICDALEPTIGGFAWLLAVILFFVLLIITSGNSSIARRFRAWSAKILWRFSVKSNIYSNILK